MKKEQKKVLLMNILNDMLNDFSFNEIEFIIFDYLLILKKQEREKEVLK